MTDPDNKELANFLASRNDPDVGSMSDLQITDSSATPVERLKRQRENPKAPVWLLIAVGIVIPPLGLLMLLIYWAKMIAPEGREGDPQQN